MYTAARSQIAHHVLSTVVLTESQSLTGICGINSHILPSSIADFQSSTSLINAVSELRPCLQGRDTLAKELPEHSHVSFFFFTRRVHKASRVTLALG